MKIGKLTHFLRLQPDLKKTIYTVKLLFSKETNLQKDQYENFFKFWQKLYKTVASINCAPSV